jgi:transposase-like protein
MEGSRCSRFWRWPRRERSADIRSDLGQGSNAGQRQKRRNPKGESALGRLAALAARSKPAAGIFPRVRLAIRPKVFSRDPSLLFSECPHCDTQNVAFVSSRKVWSCRECRKQFSAKVGTIFEDSPIGLDKWFCAFWLIANAKNGISSYELHRAIGVTQKSAWFMLQRIRLAMQNGSLVKIGGNGNAVEVDETFIGGIARNMHRAKRKARIKCTGVAGKTAVQGLLERKSKGCSKVIARVMPDIKTKTLEAGVRKYVLKGSEVMTDTAGAYYHLADNGEYEHQVINHAVEYVRGHVHTNGLENFWSLLKRSIKGTYVSVEPFHLFRYLDEQAFRFNERKDNDQGRFIKAISGVFGKGLRYAQLIGSGKGGETTPGAWQTA